MLSSLLLLALRRMAESESFSAVDLERFMADDPLPAAAVEREDMVVLVWMERRGGAAVEPRMERPLRSMWSLSGRTNIPNFGSQLKYRSSSTLPSFLPGGKNSSKN